MRNVYDIGLKEKICEEYFKDQLGYKALSLKYGISRDTIRTWIIKCKNNVKKNEVSDTIKETNFIEVTDKIHSIPISGVERDELVTIFINGYSITADNKGIKAIMGALLKW